MKLKKVTEKGSPLGKRWYDDACGTALALELVGERWSLLIVRELMYGARRFGELKASLGGISANILTQRLEGLEAVGVLTRRKLAPPASVQVYELTPWGYEAETAIMELGRWAAKSPLHDTTLPLSATSIMMSFRTMISVERSADVDALIGFRFGEDRFVAHLDHGRFTVRRAESVDVVLQIDTDPVTLASVVYGGRPLADAESTGALAITGDRALAERFPGFFVLPDKMG